MIETRIREHAAPDETAAAERSWRVVEAAYGERVRADAEYARMKRARVEAATANAEHVRAEAADAARAARAPARRSRPRGPRRLAARHPARLAIALAAAAACLAVALTPAGASVRDWIDDAIGGGDRPRPTLERLPAGGRLLVAGESGAWIVQRDGAMRRLGGYREAGWSPRGLFAVGASGRRLTALETDGTVRWSLLAPAAVTEPAWSPGDGFRIAYLAGESLRVVAGDGTGDRLLARSVAPVRPAWRPGRGHVLSYADGRGRVITVDVDSGKRLGVSNAEGGTVRALEWTPRGGTLVVLLDGALRAFRATDLGMGWTLGVRGGESLAMHPSGRRVAVVATRRGTSRVLAVSLRSPARGAHQQFAARGGIGPPAWSPDGRWLLLPRPGSDQWVLLGRRLLVYSRIARQFTAGPKRPGAFPSVAGWCC